MSKPPQAGAVKFDSATFQDSMRNALYERSQEAEPTAAGETEIAPDDHEQNEEEQAEEDPEVDVKTG